MIFSAPHLAVLVLAAGVVVAVVRARQPGTAKTSPGRLRELAWYAALLLLSAVIAATIYGGTGSGSLESSSLLVPLIVTIVIALRPAWVRTIIPWTLVAYGLSGFLVLRHDVVYGGLTPYGLGTTANWDAEGSLILLQAYVFMLLGLWLLWRPMWRGPNAPSERWRRLLGRLPQLQPRAQLAALALLPAVVAVAALLASFGWSAGYIVIPVLVAGAVVVLRRWPELAARSAAAAIVGLGLVGLALVTGANHVGFHLYFSWGPQAANGILLGPVLVVGQQTMAMTAVDSIALLAAGGWLASQTFPQVRRLLGLAPEAELLSRVRQLTERRADAIDTASADLRRLERDLHDGAQARLVALGMSLRAAERLIPTSPDAAIALVAEARETSARALAELRELVRGVLPPVLADRGLADAVRGLALDSPLTVEIEIVLPGRLPPPVETACYFAVAELLTNAAKHSGAKDARIAISHAGGLLRIEVTDFGLGGADPSAGSGLAGVERRLATFDGIMAVSSPIGGPTIVVMEVPCALSSPKISSC
jgi:signal transduction histidine kinase